MFIYSISFRIFKKKLTNPDKQSTDSMIPAEKTAQFSEPLSFGTLIYLLTRASVSMM